jgi:branched-chain amino acid transport system permease protein
MTAAVRRLLETTDQCKQFYRRHARIILVILFLILVLFPLVYSKNYLLGVMCRIFLYATLTGALNVINGYSGQTCLGAAGFFCIGAYTEAILAVNLGVNFWIILPIAGIFTALIGLLLVWPTLKMSGIYLSIVTLGFSEIVRLVALNWTGLTGGPMGIKGIPLPSIFGFQIRGSRIFFYLFLALAVVFIFCTRRVIKSRIGRAWMSIREDPMAAQSLGVEISWYKALNFMYGAFWIGIAGAVYASYARFIDSTFFTLDEGWNILSMVIIGGQGTLVGPVVGAVIVNFLTEWLRPIGAWRMVAYAALIILIMWLRPQGLVGASDSILAERGFRKKRPKPGTGAGKS